MTSIDRNGITSRIGMRPYNRYTDDVYNSGA